MITLWVILISILFIYTTLILWLYLGINRVKKFIFSNQKPSITFSIIIAFRNEADNLDRLLQSLKKIDYPNDLFEVLFVNDASTDQSLTIIENFIKENLDKNFYLLENQRKSASPKKDAINTAIKLSQFDWILTTDADCEVSVSWLNTYDAFILEKKANFIAAPVLYVEKEGFIHRFQQVDWMSLLGTTIGSFGNKKPMMCSGANLGYSKKIFNKVNGFNGNQHIASGDDVFMMQKVAEKYPSKIYYLNTLAASVSTQSLSTWKELYQQRMRWAMKTGSLSNKFVKWVGIIVLAINLLLVLTPFFLLFKPEWYFAYLVLFMIKVIVDTILVYKTTQIFKQKIKIFDWILSSLFYPIFFKPI